MTETLEAAHAYHRRGLPITLCAPGTKKPIAKGWPNKRYTLDEIDREFKKRSNLNVGTVLGPAAKIIDFEADTPAAEQTFLELFDGEPPITPTFSSNRGNHRMFQWDDRLADLNTSVAKFGDLELRIGANCRGAQSLLPPSRTGDTLRTWRVSLDECEPVPLPESVIRRILQEAVTDPGAELTHSIAPLPVCAVSAEYAEYAVSAVCQSQIDAAIQATLPNGPGQRNRRLFNYARYLKAIPELANADIGMLRPHVQKWHQWALPHIRTKAFEDTWLDFGVSWQKARYPVGRGPLADTFALAVSKPAPGCAEQYADPSLRSLVALCRELQRVAGNELFFLAGRNAAEVVGLDHSQAARWLRLLTQDRVIECVKIGVRRLASEYRYLGD